LDGELFSVNNDQLKIKMWNYYIRDQLSNGDESSEGTVDIAINYNGNKPVNEQSPVVALLRSVEDDGSAATAGNTISSKSDNITITGIPDGTYYLFVIRLSNILKSKDPEPGDVYTIYDGSYYGGPDPVLIEINRGAYQNLTVNFDDIYSLPDDIRGELLCKLNSVRYDFEGNRIMVTVDIDTSAFDSDPLVCANLFAPAAYKYGRARFDRGQKKELDLQRVGTSSKWEGSALLEDYNESGKWKIGMIQIEGTVDNDVNLVGYSMENNGSINSSYWYYDWSGENDNVKIKTDVNVPEFSFSSPDSDVSGPELIIIDIDESSRDSAEFSVTVENVGSSGHRIDDHSMDLYPVKLYLFHEDSVDSDIDEAYLLEFKEMPIIEGVYAQYKAILDYNDLPGIGEWKVKAVQLIDGAGNSSFYFVYDDEIYRGG
ncbi:MAG: hypothetical protein GY855_03035, partial [candidate division Zixibacteria bacterium]|nr:hypothetical protein [candidate division Zixibacteria bacterium]